jgi:hypothetical protein
MIPVEVAAFENAALYPCNCTVFATLRSKSLNIKDKIRQVIYPSTKDHN